MTNSPISYSHTVIWLDHHKAEVIQFNDEARDVKKLHAEHHDTPQHHSDVRAEHELFGKVCSALADAHEVVVTAGHTSLADFRHFVTKHRPMISPKIVGWEVVDHPTTGQLIAFARRYFVHYERMAGTISASALHKAG